MLTDSKMSKGMFKTLSMIVIKETKAKKAENASKNPIKWYSITNEDYDCDKDEGNQDDPDYVKTDLQKS